MPFIFILFRNKAKGVLDKKLQPTDRFVVDFRPISKRSEEPTAIRPLGFIVTDNLVTLDSCLRTLAKIIVFLRFVERRFHFIFALFIHLGRLDIGLSMLLSS